MCCVVCVSFVDMFDLVGVSVGGGGCEFRVCCGLSEFCVLCYLCVWDCDPWTRKRPMEGCDRVGSRCTCMSCTLF